MSESKRINIRLGEEVSGFLDKLMADWKCSQTAAVERAIVEAHAKGNQTSETLELVRSLPDHTAIREIIDDALQAIIEARQAQRATNPAEVQGIQNGYAGLAKNAFCKHCGSKFAGNKFAQVCPECEEAGHKRVPPAECPECQVGAAL